MRTLLLRAFLPLLLLTAGCIELSTPPQEGTELPAIIQVSEEAPRVAMLETIRAGQLFAVEVISFGDGCTRAGRTAVNVVGSTADVRPYDRYTTDTGCTGETREIRHTATVRFDDVGTGTVRIHGRRMPGNEPVTVTRTIRVTTP